jgi:hypothetical protein
VEVKAVTRRLRPPPGTHCDIAKVISSKAALAEGAQVDVDCNERWLIDFVTVTRS